MMMMPSRTERAKENLVGCIVLAKFEVFKCLLEKCNIMMMMPSRTERTKENLVGCIVLAKFEVFKCLFEKCNIILFILL